MNRTQPDTTSFETIETLTGLRALESEWNALADTFSTPLLRHEWFCSAAETLYPEGTLCVIVNRTEGTICAIAPLVHSTCYGMNRTELLGSTILGEPCGFLYRDRASLQNLVENVLSLRKSILVRGIGADSADAEVLRKTLPNYYKCSKVDSFGAPWIPISTDWDKFYATISSRWRSTLRRGERRAKEFGTVEYEILTPTGENVEQSLQEVFRVEMSGWKSRVGTALQTYTALGNFFRVYSKAAASRGLLQIAFLRIDGKAAATQLSIECGKRLWVLKVGYDEQYARCSPGILLMNEVVRNAFNRSFEGFEFLGTNQPWLSIWPHLVHQYDNFHLYPSTSNAFLFQGFEFSSRVMTRLKTIMAKKRKSQKTTSSSDDSAE